MTLSVRLFARARDLAGCDMLAVDLPPGANVGELRRRLIMACPELREFLPRCAIAVGEDFATDDAVIAGASEVVIIPPVSGG
jgi:molybdopterin converting factor subunit 1